VRLRGACGCAGCSCAGGGAGCGAGGGAGERAGINNLVTWLTLTV
jgi:hypothetical protein